MTQKQLRPSTIVPPHLYVARQADRQLRQIIDDMGRPGYVLVARQMGKTNLLLNAKRELDNSSDCFVYIDVSNSFQDLRSFFRNLIDTAVEGYSEYFETISDDLVVSRDRGQALQPHKEHEQELKKLLRCIPGRLVICLDEIDALTKVEYSDSVFSLIRSTYFSGRTNFSEFRRLTYVLSGVAEPTELIKNKAISPFNIGEKIYLDDFTIDEVSLFLKKIPLELSSASLERIYYWTSGNPRITWDLCSAIESELLLGDEVSCDSIDGIVQKLYLSNFDLPPVDHVRSIVESDREIRSAIMSIHWGKSATLPDKLKDKLYLAGATTPKALDGTVRIRNRIMAEALSERWIAEIDRQKLSLPQLAAAKLKVERFDEALALYQEYLASTDEISERAVVQFELGYCHTMLGNYAEAIDAFSVDPVEKSYSLPIYFAETYWMGWCHLCLAEFEKAAEYLKVVVYDCETPNLLSAYYEARVNLAICYFDSFETNSGEIEKLLHEVIKSESDIAVHYKSTTHADRILCSAYYNLCRFHSHKGDMEAAIDCLIKAMTHADDSTKIRLLKERGEREEAVAAKRFAFSSCIAMCKSVNLSIGQRNQLSPLSFNLDDCATLLYQLEIYAFEDLLEEFVEFLRASITDRVSSVSSLFVRAAYTAINKEKNAVASRLFLRSFNQDRTDAISEERRHNLTLAILLAPSGQALELEKLYIREFLDRPDSEIGVSDFRVVYGLVSDHLRRGVTGEANALLKKAELSLANSLASGKEADASFLLGVAIFEYLRIVIDIETDNSGIVANRITKLYASIQRLNGAELPYFPASFKDDLLRRIISMNSSSSVPQAPIRSPRKYGRNEVVTVRLRSGEILSDKYKRVSALIETGEATIED